MGKKWVLTHFHLLLQPQTHFLPASGPTSGFSQEPVLNPLSGSGKGVSWKRGLFRKVHFLEIVEILENPRTMENKEESDHFLEILKNLENLEILENPPVKRPLS